MSGRIGRAPFLRQWAWLSAIVLLATGLASAYGLFWRTDLSIYDAALPTREAPSDVLIVAVDDASIAELGRWPWRRALHAALLDRLRTMGARAVALDFLLSEADPGSPLGDEALAQAMQRGPPTVLPSVVEMPEHGRPMQERLPLPLLARAAAGIGHVNLELDRDGVARSVFLREGIGKPERLHFAAALLQAGSEPVRLVGGRHPGLSAISSSWVRDYQMLIPFLGAPGHFHRVSYVDVLRGSVEPSAVRGNFVLVGATAQGLADAYPTPRSGEAQLMSGVEVTANVLEGLRGEMLIRRVPGWIATLLALIPVSLLVIGFLRLTPRRGVLLAALTLLGTLGASVVGLKLAGWWWPPSASLAAIVVMYPLWSWRRLETTQSYLEEEFSRMASERLPLFGSLAPLAAAPPGAADFLERRIELLRGATQRLRDIRRLFSEMINSLPDATILADSTGQIVIANPAAARLFGIADAAALEGTAVDAQLFERCQMSSTRFAALASAAPCAFEATFKEGERYVLVRAAPFFDTTHARVGTIVELADITELRVAQREREDVVRFLSHDMKSPASSLMGLASLQRDPTRALPAHELSHRLDTLAQRLLALVDNFVALARAESVDPRLFEDFDLRDAVQDAYDEVWAAAQGRRIQIQCLLPEDALTISGERQLLARAIINLLTNAIKFSPSDTVVELSCECRDHEAVVSVADQGPGIATERQAVLFQRFSRRAHRGADDPGGAGLGLAFVRVVAGKHRGRAWVVSRTGGGSAFCLAIPCDCASTGSLDEH